MPIKVYRLLVAYEGLEKYLWRIIDFPFDYRLDQLGYAVLAAFDSSANRDWAPSFDFKRGEDPNSRYYCYDETRNLKLTSLILKNGYTLKMSYPNSAARGDKSSSNTFLLKVLEKTLGMNDREEYPYLIAGEGKGVFDGKYVSTMELVEKINKQGITILPVYYKEREKPWDYRDFHILEARSSLIKRTEEIEKSYAEVYNW